MLSVVKRSIRAKLSLAISIVTVLVLIVYIASNSLTVKLNHGIESFGLRYLPAISAILNADRDLYQAHVAQLKYLKSPSPNHLKEFEENAQQAFDRMNKYRNLMKAFSDVQSELSSFDQRFINWKDDSEHFFSLVDQGKTNEANSLLSNGIESKFSSLRDLYDLAGEYLDSHSDKVMANTDMQIQRHELWLTIFIVCSLAIGGLITFFVPKNLVADINELSNRIQEINSGDGDLTQRINTKKTDELGKLASTFDDFVSTLQLLIREISESTQSLTDNSNNLKFSCESSQQINSKQGYNLEMVATAVNEFSCSVKEVAQHTSSASQVTNETVNMTSEGVEIIQQSVTHIGTLSDSIHHANQSIESLAEDASNIVSVLDVIRNIAEQTNLLALNAAIEAARAGEQGRGFAVVADEVRSLASKTQKSTEEIQQMIDQLQVGVRKAVDSIKDGSEKVQMNVALTNQTKSMFENIRSSTEQINDMATQIAAATEEQSSTSEEINSNLVELNDNNRKNQELSDNIYKITQDVDLSTCKLFEDVSKFKVK
ncbi:methyl-accepting chemotaxis protein [Vibrio salinus]|uniref:methyl-accepting chemotaxis protein n=1 Tax=Vibrio salinus TaxID=2899784 RepID=UPI001E601115|nr:methyl-accepting chemotaxis protein [Vibrio salinus]MCE0492627.1 methyl-accepting chemotaxis protein [Vibrio salinus]